MRDSRWERFNGLLPMVAEAAAVIQSLSDTECRDAGFLERYLIPFLGLNDEGLAEQPPEFSAAFGKGLHIWQYPNQLAAYLVWLADHAASITSYMEIGCRWGGMFVLISEWLRKQNASLRSVTAVDLLESTPLVEAYFALLRNQVAQGQLSIEATYLCASSRSPEVRAAGEAAAARLGIHRRRPHATGSFVRPSTGTSLRADYRAPRCVLSGLC